MSNEISINRSNNFDFLRLLFASLVIISHSYPLTGKPELIAETTGNQMTLGSLSVDSFFIMSGYLIMTSLQRSMSPYEYIWKRVLRLYPAYIVLLVLTLLFLPFVYQGKNIFTEETYRSYFFDALSLYRIPYIVNGVFETNPYPKIINGSLWSLAYEFTMYIALLFLFPIRKFKYLNLIILAIFLMSFFCTITNTYFLGNTMKRIFLQPADFYKLCTYFMAGSLLVFVNFKSFNSLWIKCFLSVILFASLYFRFYAYISYVVLPLLILLIGTDRTRYVSSVGRRIGDISYGVYIYAFIVQQALMYYLKPNTLELMAGSIIITYIFAYGSWHLIEKRMLTFKNFIK